MVLYIRERGHGVEELSLVVLRCDIPAHELTTGAIGTIVLVYGDAEAYDVEFIRAAGQPHALLTLSRDAIGPLAGGHVPSPSSVRHS